MENHELGFIELDHTADWSVRVWAPDLPRLFAQAAAAMYALMGVELASVDHRVIDVELDAPDAEGLLVAFLNELLYLGEEEGLSFESCDLRVGETHLEGRLHGAPLMVQRKEIKAVTYHGLEIKRDDREVEATIIFDV